MSIVGENFCFGGGCLVNDKVLGALMFAGGVVAIVVYVWALFFAGPLAWQIAVSVVAFIAVAAVCVVVVWVGYTLITTPAPTPPSVETEAEAETGLEETAETEA